MIIDNGAIFLLLCIFGGHLENEKVCYFWMIGSQLEKRNFMFICRRPFGKTKYLAFVLLFWSFGKAKQFGLIDI